jgi:tRNA(Ile)-lysidine synthetase-like protein
VPRRPPAVTRVLTQVTATVRTRELLEPGALVLAAVSGGPDSLCLLYSLWYLRRLLKIRVEVFHFDHRLRPDSAKDGAYVRGVSERLGLPFHLREAEGRPKKGESIEAWATFARMNGGNDVRREIGAVALAEGHTLDDQAETVLLNLVRGSGLDGLSGISPGGPSSAIVQPLIDVPHADVEAFCRALHLRPRRDPMNRDRRHLRVAIRLELLPKLEAAVGRGAKATLARTADNVRVDRDELFAATIAAAEDIVEGTRGGEVRFHAANLRALSPAMARRVVRLGVYNALGTDDIPFTQAAIDAVVDLAGGRPGRRRDLPNGRVGRRTRTHVVVTRER